MAEDKRIVINSYIADQYYNSEFYKRNSEKSLTQICNDLLEKLCKDEIVILEHENLIAVQFCAKELNKTTSFVVNSVLDRFDPTPIVKPEKLKIEITAHKKTVNLKQKSQNKVVNWP